MNQNICYNCGGEYCRRGEKFVCMYCGSYMPEHISNEEATLLYVAFQKLRLANFVEAERDFEDIIHRHPESAQGYWGHLLSKYGIKYEEDYNGKRIPTCYAASIESVLTSSDYRNAMEYADNENRNVFREHAEYIERIRKEWLEKASKEAPYDIFISYKESDHDRGIKRTQDSIAMQDLYFQLKDKGYRVFFSRESLRNKTGEKYEPYIYGALSTAKVMVVYGSKPEYINAAWVKNEWMRYQKQMREGKKKEGSLIVAYEGFEPMELPGTLSSLQCLDAGEKKFYTDLFSVIEELLDNKDFPKMAVNTDFVTNRMPYTDMPNNYTTSVVRKKERKGIFQNKKIKTSADAKLIGNEAYVIAMALYEKIKVIPNGDVVAAKKSVYRVCERLKNESEFGSGSMMTINCENEIADCLGEIEKNIPSLYIQATVQAAVQNIQMQSQNILGKLKLRIELKKK